MCEVKSKPLLWLIILVAITYHLKCVYIRSKLSCCPYISNSTYFCTALMLVEMAECKHLYEAMVFFKTLKQTCIMSHDSTSVFLICLDVLQLKQTTAPPTSSRSNTQQRLTHSDIKWENPPPPHTHTKKQQQNMFGKNLNKAHKILLHYLDINFHFISMTSVFISFQWLIFHFFYSVRLHLSLLSIFVC